MRWRAPHQYFIKVARRREARRRLIVIAFHDRAIQFPNAFHAFSWIGVIADHITKAHKTRTFARACIRQHRLQRLKIGVNIAENCKPHRPPIQSF